MGSASAEAYWDPNPRLFIHQFAVTSPCRLVIDHLKQSASSRVSIRWVFTCYLCNKFAHQSLLCQMAYQQMILSSEFSDLLVVVPRVSNVSSTFRNLHRFALWYHPTFAPVRLVLLDCFCLSLISLRYIRLEGLTYSRLRYEAFIVGDISNTACEASWDCWRTQVYSLLDSAVLIGDGSLPW